MADYHTEWHDDFRARRQNLFMIDPPPETCRLKYESAGEVSKSQVMKDRFDYLPAASMGISESLPAAEPRLGRRTALTLPLLPPPQKN
jgi:hypothetical protein